MNPSPSMCTRRFFLPLLTCCGITILAACMPARAADERVDASLAEASKYLLAHQDLDPRSKAYGSISNRERNETAMTALSLLALASVGHQPADPSPEGKAMKLALDYVLRPDVQDTDGYFGKTDGSRMYGHGITTLMLAEMSGMAMNDEQDVLLRTRLRKALDLILRAQRVPKGDQQRGGWRYTPSSGDSDMSVTVWQTMALRAARNAGFEIPKESIDDAVRYIKRSYEPEGEKRGAKRGGGFGYQGRGRDISTTSEGLLALLVCGDYDSEEVRGAADRLLNEGIERGERWFFYTTYYYAQSMYQRGGRYAEEGRKVVSQLLLPIQERDGSWEGRGGEEKGGGRVYATSMAMLSLAVKNHFLPIYQR